MYLSDKKHWDAIYSTQGKEVKGAWRPIHYEYRAIASVIEEAIEFLKPDSIMEIGAGDSSFLPYLAKKYHIQKVIGIDYSVDGCRKLQVKMDAEGVESEIMCEDIFKLENTLLAENKQIKVDFIFSLGFIEHFDDTQSVIATMNRFLNDNGVIVNTIPNFSRWSFHKMLVWAYQPKVLYMHNMLSLNGMENAHMLPNLHVIKSGYLGVFSMGIPAYGIQPRVACLAKISVKVGYALTKLIRKILKGVNNYNGNSIFAPYIFCVAQRKS